MNRLLLPGALFVEVIIGVFTIGIEPTPQQPTPAPTRTAIPAPLRPTYLRISSNSPTTDVLSWNGVNGARRYEVQVKVQTSVHTPWQTLHSESLNRNIVINVSTNAIINVRHNDVKPSVTYLYRVPALDSSHAPLGEWSHTALRTVPTPTH